MTLVKLLRKGLCSIKLPCIKGKYELKSFSPFPSNGSKGIDKRIWLKSKRDFEPYIQYDGQTPIKLFRKEKYGVGKLLQYELQHLSEIVLVKNLISAWLSNIAISPNKAFYKEKVWGFNCR